MDSSVAQNPVANGAAAGGAAPTGPAIDTPRPIDFSGAPRIPKRIAAVILNSLKGGVVPRIGLPYITVGRETEIRALLTDLDLIADGGASFRFLVGRYGAGKSFLLQTIRTHAMGENFVVADADLSADGEARVRAFCASLEEMVHGYDFSRMLMLYYRATVEGDDALRGYVAKWLRGEYRTKTEAKSELGSTAIITDDDWYDYVKLLAAFLQGAGYRGLLVLIDELVNLYKIPNAISRQYNYEKILQMYNDTLQGKARHLGIIMGGTPTSVEDRRRGVFSYEALRSRLTQGRFAREGMRDMLAPIIRLHPLTYEELLILIEKLAQIHAGYFGYTPALTELDLVGFLTAEFGRVGAESHLTPREVIRDFIELLDIAYQNPDTSLPELLGSAGAKDGAVATSTPGATVAPDAAGVPGAMATPASTTGRSDAEFAEFTL